jgi:hypothetical protein
MRPVNDSGKFTVASQVKDGKVQVVINALDKDDEFLNFLKMNAAAIDPELKDFDVEVQQVAPGRYVAEFDTPKDGNYFINVHPGPGHAPLLLGVNVPYSSEFRERESNMALLESLARMNPKGGQSGQMLPNALERGTPEKTLSVDTFRGGLPLAISIQDVWPMVLVTMACVFFADVFVRRVTVSFEWLIWLWNWLRARILGRRDEAESEERLERLRTRKAAISEQIDERRAATRFEPVLDDAVDKETADEVLRQAAGGAAATPPPLPSSHQLSPDSPEAESYTARLLKAKQQAKQKEQN